ncbi:molybdopterin-binding protein [Oceaniglobus indicus]|uniref:molybdopterin-binding protein n=1 Tax=Oceaniglobus indicus TaxID=2047749 RepID=UPI000C179A5F|nr:molybdopterin-binding protein [Oceaniglobus indicus]
MDFGEIPVARAIGAILAHSVRTPEVRLRKGLTLGEDHIAQLTVAGVASVVVARPGPGDVHEDAAATRLADALIGDDPAASGLRASKAATGRVNLYSTVRGVVRIDRAAVNAINGMDPSITVATVPEWHHTAEGGMVATIKIIPYATPGAALAQAETVAQGAIAMAPTALSTVTLIQTTTSGDDGAKGDRAVAGRMATLGLTMGDKVLVAHDEAPLAAALKGAGGDLLLILTASATSDIRDVGPMAVVRAGGHVHRYGMPVDPGNLLFIGDLGGRPVIGLPGCARSPALNGADWVLQRVVCGIAITDADIAAMGVGGLLKEIPTRPRPREG